METYITLVKFTDQGFKNIKQTPARIDALEPAIEAAGGKLLGWYATQGRYDVVSITQVPDVETGARLRLAIAAQGNVRMEAMRAFTAAEFKDMIAKLP